MCVMRNRDQVFRIQNIWIEVMDVLGAHRVHVMDLDHLDDLESLDT